MFSKNYKNYERTEIIGKQYRLQTSPTLSPHNTPIRKEPKDVACG